MNHKPHYVGLHLYRFPKGLWRTLKHRALRENKSLSEIVARMIRMHLKRETIAARQRGILTGGKSFKE
jgi:hypothetical protein